MSARFTIDRLGAQGDGVADTSGGPVFIPFALPGETVTAARVKDRADLIAVIEASPQRVEPACRHFTVCGGCALQHLDVSAYLAWKRDKVVQALASKGIDAPVDDIVPCAPGSRRRVVLSARRRADGGVALGYNKALSNEIVDIEECPIALPEIVAALPRLRRLAGRLATRDAFHLTVVVTASGLDVAATGATVPSGPSRLDLSSAVIRDGFARLALDGDIVVEPAKPQIRFGTATVTPPPGGFLQAVAPAEEAMAALVLDHLGKARRVADLFSGVGTFALRLAARSAVHAVEGDAAALAALDRGFRGTPGLKPVTVERRDLFRRPLLPAELAAFDGLVFDPPRAGAEEQCRQIARAAVPLVAAVSCNPGTLARDLAILVAGGYCIRCVVPIDQFLWSPHVEAVALLEKPKRR